MLYDVWISSDENIRPITKVKYKSSSLTNLLYEIIDNRNKRREIIRSNKAKELLPDLRFIRKHRDNIVHDEEMNYFLTCYFQPMYINTITPLDRVFLNFFYKKLLRAKLEQDFIGRELPKDGLKIRLIAYLALLRLICQYLNVDSSIDKDTFNVSLLSDYPFWQYISRKFHEILGERDVIILNDNRQVLLLLNKILNNWSGSILREDGNLVKIIPLKCITRLVSKLK